MKTLSALVAVLTLAACGGSSSTGLDPATVSAYDSSTLAVAQSVATYDAAATGIATADDCAAAVRQYAAQVLPQVEQLRNTARRMDEGMRSMGNAACADMECGAEVLRQRIEQHLGSACGSGDMDQDRIQAQLHCDDMLQLTDRLRTRDRDFAPDAMYGTMTQGSGTTGGGTAQGGSTATCDPMPGCQFQGGTFQPAGT